MKANELRLGNYVQYNGFNCAIYGIQSPKPYKDKGFDGKFIIDLFDGGGLITTTIEEVKPILLAEEILLKCGFTESNYPQRFFMQTGETELYLHDIGADFEIYIAGCYINTIQCVHELQNLYFGLTGEELEVNL